MRKHELLVGQTFGLWTVLGEGRPYLPKRGGTQARVRCRCACGTERDAVWPSDLVNGKTTSCGCTRLEGVRQAGPLRRREIISYFGVHRRIKRDRGLATTHRCIDCDQPAQQWSYDGGDPDELYYDPPGKRRLAYSMDQEWYSPRCRSCHYLHDGIEPPPETRVRARGARRRQ